MKLEQRIVTKIPLEELWTDSAILSHKRQEYLTEPQALDLILASKTPIVIADLGVKLSWIPSNDTLSAFKKLIKGHIVNDPDRIILEEYEGEWCYLASEWVNAEGEKILLLERLH